MRVTRKTKKKLRAIILCHTGNKDCRKLKFSKNKWLEMQRQYEVWLKSFNITDRQTANAV